MITVPSEQVKACSTIKRSRDRLSALKDRATYIRWKGINYADKYLIEFESNFTRRGGKISWVLNEKDAIEELKGILKVENGFVSEVSVRSEWQQIGKWLNRGKNDLDKNVNPVIITDALYLLADPGLVCIQHYTVSAGSKLIILSTPDQILPSLMNMETLITLHSAYAPLKNINFYSSDVHVVIVENHVSALMKIKSHRELLYMLSDIQWKNQTWREKINLIKEQVLSESAGKMTDCYSSPLDGIASASCPVSINFEKLILLNRQSCVNRNYIPNSERWFYFFWTKAVLKRRKVSLTGLHSFDYYVNALFNKSEEKLRIPLAPAPKSFSKLWKERKGLN
ncbi:MAG: hypothetical protein LC117_08555 [Bacteroidia bacterium]|nr:hypothetical protein [Bacteroidia bacterium]